ncbi:MAG: hypothetical protein H6905_00365 [Hyphomicrobiales bacterium]|nr:hypothetical protein [Hyphomicrobiales bacterium]
MKNGQCAKRLQDDDVVTARGGGHDQVVVTEADESDRPDWAMGHNELNPHSKGGGQPADAGDMKGDLYGDLYVLLRDLDASDGDGDINGEPELDGNGNEILIGLDGSLIYKTAEGDIPEELLEQVQEVEFSRLSVARSPAHVTDHALEEAMTKLEAATSVTLDAAGRIVADGETIDSPLENLALYHFLMTTDQAEWPAYIPENVDIPALFGAAADKATPVTLDTLIYENSILGVNEIDPETRDITYEDYSSFDYSRSDKYGDVTVSWYEDDDGDLTDLELQTDSVLNAVFGGEDWVDEHEAAGVDDFAQAADDARAVISFLHEMPIFEPVEADILLA